MRKPKKEEEAKVQEAKLQAGSKEQQTHEPADSGQVHWYVVHTYASQEEKVAAALDKRITSEGLSDKIFDIMVPTQKKIEIKEGRKQESEERIFPGYILVKMLLDDRSWLAVRSTTGVTGFVGVRNRPTPLPDEEVEIIKKFSQLEAPKFKTAFSVGEAVKIVDGPFSEFLGTVNEIDEEKGKVKVLVSIFGRETP
ncbi:transcription termination/antitermination factor NusG, partial [Candidatus Curtissbacteria bacterium RBG_16_39_7]